MMINDKTSSDENNHVEASPILRQTHSLVLLENMALIRHREQDMFDSPADCSQDLRRKLGHKAEGCIYIYYAYIIYDMHTYIDVRILYIDTYV